MTTPLRHSSNQNLVHSSSAKSVQTHCSCFLELLNPTCRIDRGVKWDQIFLGVGSDEAIDMIMRIFCAPGKDAILITPPTYGMYTVCAKVNGQEATIDVYMIVN